MFQLHYFTLLSNDIKKIIQVENKVSAEKAINEKQTRRRFKSYYILLWSGNPGQ